MAFENTMTEQDMERTTRNFGQEQRGDMPDIEPDLAVDGLSDSVLSRILGLFGRESRR
ncbi:MAG: hypothetical protein R3358_13420 [Woeseiaceae bacterium]|nr:hypothetical protein [Woeseiaceae bacterium]